LKPATYKTPKIRLTIPAVQSYLESKGWEQVRGTNPNVLIYRGPKDVQGNPLVVALPARANLIDARERLADVVETVAIVEDKPRHLLMRHIVARGRSIQSVPGDGTFKLKKGRHGGERTPKTRGPVSVVSPNRLVARLATKNEVTHPVL
jgi:hypothetical protein